MKKAFITVGILFSTMSYSYSQIKGDNYLGLNIGTEKNTTASLGVETETKGSFIGVSYSRFIQDNRRLSLNVNFSKTEFSGGNDGNGNGFSVGYGVLYPLLKNFYAELTPNFGYQNSKYTEPANNRVDRNNAYSANLTGGLLFVPFKHFGISANLASLSFRYNTYKSSLSFNNQPTETKRSSVALNSEGSLQNQNFSIFFKF